MTSHPPHTHTPSLLIGVEEIRTLSNHTTASRALEIERYKMSQCLTAPAQHILTKSPCENLSLDFRPLGTESSDTLDDDLQPLTSGCITPRDTAHSLPLGSSGETDLVAFDFFVQ